MPLSALRLFSWLLLLTLVGCGTPSLPPGADSTRWGTRGRSAPTAIAVPSSCQRMVNLARQEWTVFGALELNETSDQPLRRQRSAQNVKHELEGPMLARVLAYWTGLPNAPTSTPNGPLRPWSGAFISWLARSAGHGPRAFPLTAMHWDYIERFMTAEASSAFVARDVTDYAPQAGDLVCSTRDPALEAAGRPLGMLPLEALRRGNYHCDLVVETPRGEVHMIGGNVSDSVALTRVASDNEGRLRPDRRRVWAAVLAQRAQPPDPARRGGRAASGCAQ